MTQGDGEDKNLFGTGTSGGEQGEGTATLTPGGELMGNDPAGQNPTGVGEIHGGNPVTGEGASIDTGTPRPGDWDPGQREGGGEVY